MQDGGFHFWGMAKHTRPNPRIEALLSGNMHIDAFDALEAYARYNRDLEYLASGGDYAALGYSESRKRSMPQSIIVGNGDAFQIVSKVRDSEGIDAVYDYTNSGSNAPSIGYLELTGVMRTEGGPSSYGVAQTAHWVTHMANDPALEGVILRVRSGGGESMSMDILRTAIQSSSKPIVAYIDRAGSAAYGGIIDADELIASSPRARTGSLGSYISLDRKAIKKYSKNIIDVYSELSPDKNYEFREVFKGNMEPLIAMVRTDATEFREAVREARPLRGSAGTIEKTLSGGMFPAQEAKQRGLIDGVGTLSYAIRRVRALAA